MFYKQDVIIYSLFDDNVFKIEAYNKLLCSSGVDVYETKDIHGEG